MNGLYGVNGGRLLLGPQPLVQASLPGCSFWLQMVPGPCICHCKQRRNCSWMLSVYVISFQPQNHPLLVLVTWGGILVTRKEIILWVKSEMLAFASA